MTTTVYGAYPAARVEPLYLEVSSLLSRKLTGIGRLVARLVEALSRIRPLRLVSTVPWELARGTNLSPALLCGQEIALEMQHVARADEDVGVWTRQLLQRPRRPHDARAASRLPGIYTLPRPAERHFGCEVCLLYDFTPLLLPWTHLPGTRDHFGMFFANTSALCDGAVAISESTKADAAWLCALPEEKVVVGYPGPSLCVEEHAQPGPVRRRGDVLLVVSTLEPRKNGRFLLDWFLGTKVLPESMELWWVGPVGWMQERWTRLPRGRGRRVRFLGMVSDRRLCALYRQAACSIYPSLYEGFGFPVLDSLWHDTPVLCSLNSSLQEFAGPGVYFFDACAPDSLDAAFQELCDAGPGPVDRAALAERFSWNALAQKMSALCA